MLSPIACTIYVIIVIILVWPLLFPLIRKILPARAAGAVESMAADPALQVAEHHVTTIDEIEPPAAPTTKEPPDGRTKEDRR